MEVNAVESKKDAFVNNAKKYIGQGPGKFRKWFYRSDRKNVPWCAIFVSYVAKETGILETLIPKNDGAGSIARDGVKNGCGKWYESEGSKSQVSNNSKPQVINTSKPQVGDLIFFVWNAEGKYPDEDIYYSDHIGIVSKVGTKYVYTIEGNSGNNNDTSKVAEGKYTLDSKRINGYFRPYWNKPDAIYRIRTGGRWYPAIKSLTSYAGIIGKPITDIAVKFSEGTCKYRVHVKGGKWLPWVTGYNIKDDNNGYAGDKKVIDAIQIVYNGKFKAQYRVSPVGRNYYSYQKNIEKTKDQDGYAGSYGTSIDRLQITLGK